MTARNLIVAPGQIVPLRVKFYANGQLFDPQSFPAAVGLYTAAVGGTPFQTATPVRESFGIWYVNYTVPANFAGGNIDIYDEWTWMAEATIGPKVQRYHTLLQVPATALSTSGIGQSAQRFEATTPTDLDDPPRFAQPVETTKDAVTLELQKFFNRQSLSSDRLQEIPTIRKYEITTSKKESAHETAVKLIQKYPNIQEHLPLVAIIGATGRNVPMSIGGKHVATIRPAPTLHAAEGPYALADGQTLQFQTASLDGEQVFDSEMLFRGSRFVNIAAATPAEVAREINFQALYARAVVSISSPTTFGLAYGGPCSPNPPGTITITGGTAAAALGFTPGQTATYTSEMPYHRLYQSTGLDLALEVVAEDYNIRTELTDLVWSFFTFFLERQQFTFLGRSITDSAIPSEIYQVIIKPDLSMSGEQEVPRPGDEKDKLFVNRINLAVTTIQYLDRAVRVPGTGAPYYVDSVEANDTIPAMS